MRCCRACHGSKWTHASSKRHRMHRRQEFYINRGHKSVLFGLTLGQKHVFDHLWSNDGHIDRFNVHLLFAFLGIMALACSHGSLLFHPHGNSEHFSHEISGRLCLGLPRVPLLDSPIPKDKWLLLLRSRWRSASCCFRIQDFRVLMDVLFRLFNLLYANLAHDCPKITLLDRHDFGTCFRSLLLHYCNKVSRLSRF